MSSWILDYQENNALTNAQCAVCTINHSNCNYTDKNRLIDFKRLFDITFSLSVMIVFSPLFLFIMLITKLFSPNASAIYAHKRIGLNGKEFKCYKFRTMVANADEILKELIESSPEIKAEFEQNFKLKNDPRIITVIGNFLRKTSLDELPQFFNVLIGDMSVVGPRPIVKAEMNKYGSHICKLLSVKPGITGFWQVSGRSDVSYKTRIEKDMHYINNGNFLLDCKIIFKTVGIMLLKKGAY